MTQDASANLFKDTARCPECKEYYIYKYGISHVCNTIQKADLVNHPPHYTNGSIECIDAIEASMSKEGFQGYCKGNALKYIWRYEKKGGTEDLRKSIWYISRLIKSIEAS